MEELRISFHFASFAQFCFHFDTISGDDFHLRELEDAFMAADGKDLGNLWQRLLKHFPSRPHAGDSLLESVRREYRKRNRNSPTQADLLSEVNLEDRLQISYDLSNFILENGDSFMKQVLKGEDDLWGGWRNEPVGKDSKGRVYWVLAEGRLYREAGNRRRLEPTNWELLCHDLFGWRQLLEVGLGIKPADKKLLVCLRDEIFPIWEADLQAEERRVRKHRPLDHLPVKRSSRLQEKQLQQLLEEEKQRALEAERQQALKEQMLLNPTIPMAGDIKRSMSREERLALRANRQLQMALEKSESELETVEVNVDSPSSPLKLVFRPAPGGGYQSEFIDQTWHEEQVLSESIVDGKKEEIMEDCSSSKNPEGPAPDESDAVELIEKDSIVHADGQTVQDSGDIQSPSANYSF